MKKCNYTKTASGRCHQTAIQGDKCYYHRQVSMGHIRPTDEVTLFKEMREASA